MRYAFFLLTIATGLIASDLSGTNLRLSLMHTGPKTGTIGERSYQITFDETQYNMTLLGPGGPTCSAPYQVEDTKIRLEGSTEFCKKQVCKFVSNLTSVEGTQGLQCGKTIYYAEGDRPEKGAAVKVNGISAIAMGYVPGSTTTKVVIRSAPSKSSKPIACTGKVPDTLNLMVLARTAAKMKVDNWNNYWYYVFIHGDENSFDCGNKPQWIFGEFVKVQ
jgi:hypothetical protein